LKETAGKFPETWEELHNMNLALPEALQWAGIENSPQLNLSFVGKILAKDSISTVINGCELYLVNCFVPLPLSYSPHLLSDLFCASVDRICQQTSP